MYTCAYFKELLNYEYPLDSDKIVWTLLYFLTRCALKICGEPCWKRQIIIQISVRGSVTAYMHVICTQGRKLAFVGCFHRNNATVWIKARLAKLPVVLNKGSYWCLNMHKVYILSMLSFCRVRRLLEGPEGSERGGLLWYGEPWIGVQCHCWRVLGAEHHTRRRRMEAVRYLQPDLGQGNQPHMEEDSGHGTILQVSRRSWYLDCLWQWSF